MSSCVRFNDDQPSPVSLWSASQKGSTQCNSPDLLSLCLSLSVSASHRHFPHVDRDGKKERTRGRPFWIRFGGEGGCLYDDFSFEKKEKHQSSAGFCEGFNTALSPVVCVVVSSECYVFDMRVNNGPAGKRSVCVFTALHTLRWGVSLSLSPSNFRLGFEEQGLGVGLKFVCFTFSERELPFLSSFLLIFSHSPYEHSHSRTRMHGKSRKHTLTHTHTHTHIHIHLRSEVVWSAEAAYVNAERLSSVWVCIHQGNQASADGESSLQEQIRSTGSHTAVTELLPIMGLRGAGGGGREHVCVCVCVCVCVYVCLLAHKHAHLQVAIYFVWHVCMHVC